MKQCTHCGTRLRGDGGFCPLDGHPLELLADPLMGRTIAGRYLVEAPIGSGGMGSVYSGRHQAIDRPVAIKFLHSTLTSDDKQRKRFLGEARAANQINHEHIIDITDYGETEEGRIYLVMEFLEGHSLAQDVARGPLSVVRAVDIAIQVATGLARAHELDVIHRDVKPANIYLTRRHGRSDFVKLLDFGIAHFERDVRITDRNAIVGTPEYMSPELLRKGQATPRSDLYALGCVLYECLVGKPPFSGNMSAVMVKQMTTAPPLVVTQVQQCPAALGDLIQQLLHKNPEQRHRDAHHLVEELARIRAALPTDTSERMSERPSLDTRDKPTMHAPSEEQEWGERLSQFRQMLELAHAQDAPPEPVRSAITRIEELVDEVRVLREDLNGKARAAASQEDGVRSVRDQICAALDELARDDSRRNRELEGQRVQLERDEARFDGALVALGQCLAELHFEPQQGASLGDRVAEQLSTLKRCATSVHEARKRLQQGSEALQGMLAAQADLHFQLAQLKGRLGSLNASSEQDKSESHHETDVLDQRIHTHLEEIVSRAQVVTTHLREQPELAQRFSLQRAPLSQGPVRPKGGHGRQ